MKKFLICEILIALFALTGFYYYLTVERPVRMPERPITSESEIIASLPFSPGSSPLAVSVAPEPEKAVTVAEQTVVVAVLPAAGAVSGDAAGDVSDAGVEKSEPVSSVPEKPEIQPSPDPEGTSVENQDAQINGKEAPAPVGKDNLAELETQPEVAETSPAPLSEPPVIVAGEYVLHSVFLRNLKRLKSLGFVARTEEVVRPTPIFRVFLGPFRERQEALTMMSAARKKGDDPFLLVRSGAYKVVVGSFYLQSSVDDWKKLYAADGFTIKVQKVSVKMLHFLVLLDGPRVRQDADSILTLLHDAGFSDARLR